MTIRHRAYLGMGSNLGDRAAYLRLALSRLDALPETRVQAVSSTHETPPWGHTAQPDFLNLAVMVETALPPETLLTAVLAIEEEAGRQRGEHWGPRTLDIDLLVYEGETRDTPTLQLPHPFLTQRRFVLAPLAEIAPGLVVAERTVHEWLETVT